MTLPQMDTTESTPTSATTTLVTEIKPASTSRLDKLEALIPKLSPSVTDDAATCLRHLASFTASVSATPYPPKKLAGVLILLHIDATGNLSLTLTTRSLRLRSHPGETALPGGRYEDSDTSVEATALREANEEIGLPLSDDSLFHLTTLPPFTSRTMLVVIPVVYLLTTPFEGTQKLLKPNPDEVDAIFHLPLKAFLGLDVDVDLSVSSPSPPPPKKRKTRSKSSKSILTHSYQDLIWLSDRLYRLHSFDAPDLPSPVEGLTADIIVSVALIGYYGMDEVTESKESGEGKLGFLRWAEGQLSWAEITRLALEATGEKGVRDQRTSKT
ncbi:hypothetical protein MNV49_004772 [Pseudohyphozyma bogoriensis]|nr:hypothetical protein MNV49_004772 [Pseudohyphozyma bogoriensis]